MVWIDREIIYIECPFCHKDGVKTMYNPPTIEARTSRSAIAKATRFHKIHEKYEIIDGCKFCGKSKREIEKAGKEGISKDEERMKKRLEELKKLGFTGKITTEVQH
jgi:hypothetical protein